MASEPDGLRGVPVAATSLTHIDGERGRLTIAGYAIEELAPRCSFEEACFLLLHRRLPNAAQLRELADRFVRDRQMPPALLAVARGAAARGLAALLAVARGAAARGLAPIDALMTLTAHLRRPNRDPEPIEVVAGLMTAAGCYARLRAARPNPNRRRRAPPTWQPISIWPAAGHPTRPPCAPWRPI